MTGKEQEGITALGIAVAICVALRILFGDKGDKR